MDEATRNLIESVVGMVSAWGLKVLGALIVLIVGRWAAGRVRKAVRQALERSNLEATLIPFIAGIVYYVLLTVVVIAVLGLFGIQTTSLIAVLGAAGLAVGLALQGTLSNVAAGVMILIFRPFRVGEYVEAGGTAGSVVEVGIFTTTLNTPDNVKILVPNSAIYGDIVKNYSANDTRRNDLTVGIAYGDDIGRAIEVIRKVIAEDGRVLSDPAPVIAVGGLGDSSVDFVVRPWCRTEDYWPLRFDLTRKLKEALEAGGCSIPFPQRDVHLIREATIGGRGQAVSI
jgi:small conductance mechanosensitive channel